MSVAPPPPWKHLSHTDFRGMLTTLRRHVAPILANNLLPHFTDHSVAHSDNVTQLVDSLLEPATSPLTDQELLILYSACYLHDIGMHYECAGDTEVISSLNLFPPWNEESEANKRELLRAHHNRIAAELVTASVRSASPPIGFQLTSAFTPQYIAGLCHAHCIETNTAEYTALVEDGPNIRVSLLSAILRLADILDESRRRATREKARTLELDLDAQTHWWRHYYIEDVTFDSTDRMVTIWFDFPCDRLQEYEHVVPVLQLPQIKDEFERHASILLRYGLGWSVRQKSRSNPYSTVEDMPGEVFTAMLKQLASRRRAQNEEQRLVALSQFQEARPSIERRLDALNDRESSMDPGDYLAELSHIAFDLLDLGGRRSAHSVLYSRYLRDLQHLAIDDRIRIGIRLLTGLVDNEQEFEAVQLMEKLGPSLEQLPQEDERQRVYARLKIKTLISACAYPEAKAALEAALQCASLPDAALLTAQLAELQLLQGDIEQDVEI